MTPTQQERRIQALYDDANVSRRNLCERVVHLEADMEELRKQLQDTKRDWLAELREWGIEVDE